MSALESWMYQDPEKVAITQEAKRIRLKNQADYCTFRIMPIFEEDSPICNKVFQGYDRCSYCDLQRRK
jgi:hypothetical protein